MASATTTTGRRSGCLIRLRACLLPPAAVSSSDRRRGLGLLGAAWIKWAKHSEFLCSASPSLLHLPRLCIFAYIIFFITIIGGYNAYIIAMSSHKSSQTKWNCGELKINEASNLKHTLTHTLLLSQKNKLLQKIAEKESRRIRNGYGVEGYEDDVYDCEDEDDQLSGGEQGEMEEIKSDMNGFRDSIHEMRKQRLVVHQGKSPRSPISHPCPNSSLLVLTLRLSGRREYLTQK